ncbi:MAG: selenium metabolism-associated LysR family transcriptional regulator [Dehalococcoidia bacterium]
MRQLEIFCAVVREKGFSSAAAKLNITQPTVSFQIAALEQELGTRVLDRSGRTTTTTRTGEILYRYATQILELKAEAVQSISKLQGLFWGEVVIGASTIPGEYILPGLLPRFRQNYPGISVTVIIDDSKGIIRKVLEKEVEIGVVGAIEKNEKLNFTPFVSDKMVLISPKEKTWFPSKPATIDELKRVPFILREEGSGTRAIMEQKLSEANVRISDLSVAMVLGSTESVKFAVRSGAGVSIISERAVENDSNLGLIKVMDIEGLQLNRQFFLVNHKQKLLSPAAEAMLSFLVD